MPRQWLTDGMEVQGVDTFLQKHFADYVRNKYPNYEGWAIKLYVDDSSEFRAQTYTVKLTSPHGKNYQNTVTLSDELIRDTNTSVVVYALEKCMAEIFNFTTQEDTEKLKNLLNMLV